MDLSVRKPQPVPTYVYQGAYVSRDLPPFTYHPSTYVPASMEPPVSHLGLFQQLQYAPQASPPREPVPVRSPEVSTATTPERNNYKIPVSRPFKAMNSPKSRSFNLVSALDPAFEAEYEEYRNEILSRVSHDEPISNRNMKRNIPSNPEKSNDPEYLEKRKKNNEAAKKSREARKAKEDELAIRVAFLEKENLKMKFKLAAIEREKKMILMRRNQI